MPGPLPAHSKRRRNAPTIPTTDLPLAGYDGPVPEVPKAYKLGKPGRAWWDWAWSTPQAAAWSVGDTYALARRAALEDDLHAIDVVDNFDLAEILGLDERNDQLRALEAVIYRLKALAGGRITILREQRELDERFGLTAKGMAALRWKIVAPIEGDQAGTTTGPGDDELSERRKGRRARIGA